MLQLIASKGWQLQSFDICATFLQGKPQTDRVLAIEPVEELVEALQLATNQVCKLEKGAYGLIDAPYQWFLSISEELVLNKALSIHVSTSSVIMNMVHLKEY